MGSLVAREKKRKSVGSISDGIRGTESDKGCSVGMGCSRAPGGLRFQGQQMVTRFVASDVERFFGSCLKPGFRDDDVPVVSPSTLWCAIDWADKYESL